MNRVRIIQVALQSLPQLHDIRPRQEQQDEAGRGQKHGPGCILPIELQRKLDLPRPIRIVTRRSNFSEVVPIREIRIRGLQEARSIGQIEALGTELNTCPLGRLKALEHREIELSERRSRDGSPSAAQRRVVPLADGPCRSRIRKRIRIVELRYIVFPRVGIANQQCIAVEA